MASAIAAFIVCFVTVARMILQGWETWLATKMPRRIVGEMDLSEQRFDDLTATLREHGWRMPPSQYPRVVLVVMTFTARFHYFGSFWNALKTVLSIDDIDNSAWGTAFRTALKKFDLLVPPVTWMVNVGPVLFHAILPAGCEDEFAEFFDSLSPEVDLASMTDHDLGEIIRTWPFGRDSLRAFMQREESRPIALDLVRAVYSDLRLSRLTGATLSGIRGQIVTAIQQLASQDTTKQRTGLTILGWKYSRSTNTIGLQLPGLAGEMAVRPELLKDGALIDLTIDLGPSGYIVPTQRLAIPPSTQGFNLELAIGNGVARRYRVNGLPTDLAVFKLTSSSGSLTNASSLVPGMYLFLYSGSLSVSQGAEVKAPAELPLTPDRTSYLDAAIYELETNDIVHLPNKQRLEVTEALRPEVTLQTKASWFGTIANRDGPIFDNNVRLLAHSPYDGAELVIFDDAKNIVYRAAVRRSSLHDVRLQSFGHFNATIYLDGQPAGSNVESFFVCDLRILSGSWRNVEACDFLATGTGAIRIGRRVITLNASQKRIPVDELAGGAGYYLHGSTLINLTYLGARPLRWRLGSTKGQLSAVTLEKHVSELPAGETIEVSANPGERVSLAIGTHALADTFASPQGFARFSIQEALDYLRRRDEMASLVLVTASCRTDCLRVFAVPRLIQGTVSIAGSYLSADLGFDRPVDRVRVAYRAAHQYWEPRRFLTLTGGPRFFQGNAWIGIPALLEVSVEAQTDKHFVTVLAEEEPWSRIIGDDHSDAATLEAHLARFFQTGHDTDLASALGTNGQIRRALELLLAGAMLPENSYVQSKITAGLRVLAPLFSDANIGILEDVIHGNPDGVASILIHATCPVPAVPSRLLGIALGIDLTGGGVGVSLPAIESDIRQLLRFSESADGQAIGILEDLAQAREPQRGQHVAAIATFLLAVKERSAARVLEQCDDNTFNKMCYLASTLLDHAGISVEVGGPPLKGGPLTRLMHEYLRFAVAIRSLVTGKLAKTRFRLARYYASLLDVVMLRHPLSVLLLSVDKALVQRELGVR